MPIINTISGDLLDLFAQQKYTAIAHGCNTFANFGAGIALSIKEKYPLAYEADKSSYKSLRNSLGWYSFYTLPSNQIIYNLYTQDSLGWNKKHEAPPVDYTAIYRAFLKLNGLHKSDKNFLLGIPSLIGCGLAKGEPTIVRALINLATPDIDIEEVIYDKN